VTILLALLFFLYQSFLVPSTSAEDRRWVLLLAFSIINGFIGFLIDKKS
jgi:hypothetical protein